MGKTQSDKNSTLGKQCIEKAELFISMGVYDASA